MTTDQRVLPIGYYFLFKVQVVHFYVYVCNKILQLFYITLLCQLYLLQFISMHNFQGQTKAYI